MSRSNKKRRENKKLYKKTEVISTKNQYGYTDLTPFNALTGRTNINTIITQRANIG